MPRWSRGHLLGRIAQLVRAPALQAGSRGFESLCAHRCVVVQTDAVSGLRSRFRRCSLSGERGALDVRVEQDYAVVGSLEQFLALVAFCGVGVVFVSCGGVEPVELYGDQLAERGDDVLGYLHVAAIVFDGGFDVGHEHGLALAVGAFGVPTGAHEVAVDVAVAVLCVGDGESGAADLTMPTVILHCVPR